MQARAGRPRASKNFRDGIASLSQGETNKNLLYDAVPEKVLGRQEAIRCTQAH